MQRRFQGRPSIIDLLTGTLAITVFVDIANAALATLRGDNLDDEAMKSELELLEEAAAKAPSGRYVGIDLNQYDNMTVVGQFLNKHSEFEFVAVTNRRLLLERKNCNK